MINHSTFIAKLKEALGKKHCIMCMANCTITYSGRAESHLPAGDRMLIIKSDKTVLIHQYKGSVPVNYMKEGSAIVAQLKNNNAVISIENLAQKEFLNIAIHDVHVFHSQVLDDTEKIQLAGTEKDMSQHIMDNPDLIEKGFKPLTQEEHTKYGFIDVFGHDLQGNLVVVECKRFTGDLAAVTQLRRYVEKMKKMRGVDRVRGILVCPKISPNAKKMLEDWGFSYVSLRPPNYLEKYDKEQQKLSTLFS